MEKAEGKLHALKILTWFGVFTSVLLCNLQVEGVFEVLWLYLAVPILLSCLIVPVLLHIVFSVFCPRVSPTSKNLTLFCTYNFCLAISAFLVLGSLLKDELIDTYWAVVFIPVWYCLGIFGVFGCYMYPGLSDPSVGKTRQANLLVLYFLCLTVYSVLLVLYLDQDSPSSLAIVYIPLFVLGFGHIVSYATSKVKERKNPDIPNTPILTLEFSLISTIVPFSVINVLVATVIPIIPDTVIFIPIYRLLLALIYTEQKNYMRRKSERSLID